MTIPFVYDDGGRAAAGFRGGAGDCVTRAIAIAEGRYYLDVYRALWDMNGGSPRDGVNPRAYRTYLAAHRAAWTPTMEVGSGCRVHLRADELPAGRLIVRLSRHLAAVLDGVLHDTHDCSRGGTRCVYGYWTFPPTTEGGSHE